MAWLWPLSFSLTHHASRSAYFRMISTLPSVLPPSTITYSRLEYPWSRTEPIVCSRNCAWLKLGVTTVMRGRVLMSQPPVAHRPPPAAVDADLVIGFGAQNAAEA